MNIALGTLAVLLFLLLLQKAGAFKPRRPDSWCKCNYCGCYWIGQPGAQLVLVPGHKPNGATGNEPELMCPNCEREANEHAC